MSDALAECDARVVRHGANARSALAEVLGVGGEDIRVRDMLVQRQRDSRAALRLMRKLLKKLRFAPRLLVTDKLRSYASAFRRLRLTCLRAQGSERTTGPRIRISRQLGRSVCEPQTYRFLATYRAPTSVGWVGALSGRFIPRADSIEKSIGCPMLAEANKLHPSPMNHRVRASGEKRLSRKRRNRCRPLRSLP